MAFFVYNWYFLTLCILLDVEFLLYLVALICSSPLPVELRGLCSSVCWGSVFGETPPSHQTTTGGSLHNKHDKDDAAQNKMRVVISTQPAEERRGETTTTHACPGETEITRAGERGTRHGDMTEQTRSTSSSTARPSALASVVTYNTNSSICDGGGGGGCGDEWRRGGQTGHEDMSNPPVKVYLKSTAFLIDLISAIPLLYTSRAYYILLLPRLLSAVRLPAIIRRIRRRSSSYKRHRIFGSFFSLLLLWHYCSCFWFSIGNLDDQTSWLDRQVTAGWVSIRNPTDTCGGWGEEATGGVVTQTGDKQSAGQVVAHDDSTVKDGGRGKLKGTVPRIERRLGSNYVRHNKKEVDQSRLRLAEGRLDGRQSTSRERRMRLFGSLWNKRDMKKTIKTMSMRNIISSNYSKGLSSTQRRGLMTEAVSSTESSTYTDRSSNGTDTVVMCRERSWSLYYLQILMSYYYTMQVVTSVGYGDIQPQNDRERLFAILLILVADVLFAVAFGMVASVLQSMHERRNRMLDMINVTRAKMDFENTPHSIRSRAEYFFAYYQKKLSEHKASALTIRLHNLEKFIPSLMYRKFLLHYYSAFLSKVPMLQSQPEAFLLELVAHITIRIYMPSDYICIKGDMGDDMFFILEGRVIVHPSKPGRKMMQKIIGSGDFFGEMSVLYGHNRTCSVQADSFCALMVLNKFGLDLIFEQFPDVAEDIRAVARSRYGTMN
eukprot:GHVQ01018167.1.p1 GENE.GHVQ01018167.1~~GHVQ01018167.1.p1  ORF type:complete len:828 (+),score=164.21 GHVQ01018167.1:336-2486(+)